MNMTFRRPNFATWGYANPTLTIVALLCGLETMPRVL
jgi:hypothetical protein